MGKRNLMKDALKTIQALEDVNVAYRIGGRPKGSSLDWLRAHKDRVIAELGEVGPLERPGEGDFDRLPWKEIIGFIGVLQRINQGEIHFSWKGRNIIAANNGGEMNLFEVVPAHPKSIPFGGRVYSGPTKAEDIAESIHAALEEGNGEPLPPVGGAARLVEPDNEWAAFLAWCQRTGTDTVNAETEKRMYAAWFYRARIAAEGAGAGSQGRAP